MSNDFTAEELEAKTVAELTELAQASGIEIPSDARKAEIVNAIQTGEFTRDDSGSDPEPDPAPAPAPAPAQPRRRGRGRADGGAAQVQAKMDVETAKGYRGTVPDPTPNHAYSIAGVTHNEPTPETDEELHRKARGAERRG